MRFKNRKQAGQLLSEKLHHLKNENPIVLALPRGGVPVAFEVANSLGCELNVLISRKIGAPLQPELALGAICETAPPIWNQNLLDSLRRNTDDLKNIINNEHQKIQSYIKQFRNNKPLPSFENQTLILVDDGIATGATFFAAVRYLNQLNPKKIIAAIPVTSTTAQIRINDYVNEFISLISTDTLSSIGEWYEDFTQVSSEEVIKILSSCAF